MDIKDILSTIDVTVDDIENLDLDTFKKQFQTKFIARDLVVHDKELAQSIVGKRIGELETAVKRGLKQTGLEDLGDWRISDLLDKEKQNVFETLKTTHEKQVDEIKTSLQGTTEQQVKELNAKLEAANAKQTGLKEMLDAKSSEYETAVKAAEQDKTNWIIGQKKNEVVGKHQFGEAVNEFTKKGFDLAFNEKYDIKLENEMLVPYDRTTGEVVKNKSNSGIASFEEVWLNEAEPLLKKNNASPNQRPVQQFQATPQNADGNIPNAVQAKLNKAKEHLANLAK